MQTDQSIKKKVENYIAEKTLIANKKSKIIVGVSGGSDSVALLSILHTLGYSCVVAHCNFHLRGQESYRDEYFVEKLAAKLKLPFLSANFDTRKYIEDESISLEMAARELRYAWFEKIRLEQQADRIAIGHHMNDSAETVLINLIRGTGIKGLSGIAPLNGNIIRPLLCLFRNDILEYLKLNNLEFITDSTNKEDIYTRNKIRLNIMPLLEAINPAAIETIARSADNISKIKTIYNHYIEIVTSKILIDNKINIKLLLKEPEPSTILYELLSPYGFNSSTVNNLFQSINGQSGKIFYSDEYQVIKDRDFIIIDQIKNIKYEEYEIIDILKKNNSPIDLEVKLFNISEIDSFITKKDTIYIDFDKIKSSFIIRRWKEGDKFIPLGMKGHKKISDYFSDNKFSLLDKQHTWLLCTENKIIWIVNQRMDDRFKITNKTQRVLKITHKDL